MELLVEFSNPRGKKLRGMMHWPARAGGRRRVPGVVFFHGFTGDRMESHWIFIRCARALARKGVAALRFDFYGSGESDGEFREMTLTGEIADAMAAVNFMRKQKGVDAARIGLCGLSLGGVVAACVARRAKARALALWSAVAHTEIFLDLARERTKPIPGGNGMREYDAREISPRFLEDVVKWRPLEELARYRGPTLIVQPGKDESVPASHADDFFNISPAAVKEKVIIPGADHTFTSIAWEREVITRTVGWFSMYLP
jgi:uncharacterized protein